MFRENALVAVTFCLVFAGCVRDDFKLERSMVEIAERQSELFVTNAPKKLAAMSAGDVIVAVNGYPLTKEVYDNFMELRREGLATMPNMNYLAAEKMMDQYRIEYIKSFIGQRLLFDNAFSIGLVTEEEMLSAVESKLRKSAKSRGKTVSQTLKKFKGHENLFLYELCVAFVIDKLVHEKIPPKCEVGADFVEAVKAQVEINNSEAEKTNAFYKARLADYRQQILTKKLDFEAVAKMISGYNQDNGFWGDFEEGDMDDPGIQAKVFAMKEGEISDVLEDDNGYHVVKVLKVIPAEKNEEGNIVEREKRKLSHLYIEKEPMLIKLNNVQMTADLKKQMQLQAVNAYVTGLSTNSANRIEYPNGQDLF